VYVVGAWIEGAACVGAEKAIMALVEDRRPCRGIGRAMVEVPGLVNGREKAAQIQLLGRQCA
jgi:hypothetical protein